MRRGTTTIASAFSLRAPIAGEEERIVFERRLSFTLALVATLAFGFWLIQLASAMIVAPAHVVHLFTKPTSQIHLGIVAGTYLVAFAVRRMKLSSRVLDWVDSTTTVAVCFGWAAMIHIEDGMMPARESRAEMVVLLASSFTLATRAALLPSTTLRTAVLSTLGLLPIVPLTISIYAHDAPSKAWPIGPAIYAGTWATIGIACTTTISSVIYGLRQEVRKAMQLGQYLLEEKVGEGGMGVVYRASHALLRRPAAIKLLNHTEGQGVTRFEREVQITAKLTHPNTVIVFDYGRTPDGTFYYAMEFLEGISLEDLVVENGAQPARRVLHVLLQACGALEEAHANGLVHRDIKPANIVLAERGLLPDFVKVLDFGLVKEIAAGADLGQSSVNTIMGTPHYMAPEAIVDPASIDGRADLYALGATAYYLLTGERVFDGSNLVEVCSQHLHQAPTPPSKKRADIPASLEAIVLACLAKKREDRPKDAAALAKLLTDARNEIGEWSREEAHAWWTERARKSSGQVAKAKTTKAASDASVLGHTIAVALDDRDDRRGAA